MKHAYLILAHNEYEVLQELVLALDSKDNDIYVHIDKKSKTLPKLNSKFSKLILLENRNKVWWGTGSQVFTETYILKTALESGVEYDYYHIISGIHYPIKTLKEIDDYFSSVRGNCVVDIMEDTSEEAEKKLGRYHFFLKGYYSSSRLIERSSKLLWKITLRLQKILGIKRDHFFNGGKVSNWCSLTHEAAKCWVNDSDILKKWFRWTFCGDEYAPMSVIKAHNLFFVDCKNYLYLEFVQGNPRRLTDEDFQILKSSGCLFGRKFTKESLGLIELLKNEKNKNICSKS